MIAAMFEVCTDLNTNKKMIEVLEMKMRFDVVD
jgi:hypothetical protein